MSTPSPFTVTKDGGHFEVKVDAHYVSDDEVETVRRYIATLKAENAKLRELVRGLWYCTENENKAICEGCPLGTVEGDRLALACEKLMYELGVDA